MWREVPNSNDAAEDEAIVWLVRLRAQPVAPQRRREFAAWLADPMHRAAFDQVQQWWETLGCVRQLLPDTSQDRDLRGRR